MLKMNRNIQFKCIGANYTLLKHKVISDAKFTVLTLKVLNKFSIVSTFSWYYKVSATLKIS